MPGVPLTPDELLTTTRSVRNRLDLTRPVPLGLVKECLEIALQAPNGGMREGWHWIVVTDAEQRYAARYRIPRPNPQRVVIEVTVTRVLGSDSFTGS